MVRLRAPWIVPLLLAALALPARAEPAADFSKRKAEAEALAQKNDPRAEAMLRQLMQEAPNDSWLSFRYGYSLLIRATTMKAGPERTALVKNGRSYLLKAKAAGLDEPLIDPALAIYHEDGSISENENFSKDAQADTCIKAAEKSFAQGKFDEAMRNYRKALKVDPENFTATLYIGDTYFAQDRLEDAITWYGKAIDLRPNVETSYRYRADALRKLGRANEAINSYVAAVVADPYSRLTWHSLTMTARAMGYAVRYRASPLPKADLTLTEDKKDIMLPSNSGGLTLAYATARAKWVEDNHALAFAGGHYRQSLAEEKSALEALLQVVAGAKQRAGPTDPELGHLEAELGELEAIAKAGLLEPHILLTRANADIAQDYAAYRKNNREKIATYLKQFYLGE
jgi:tetratricopeptide (TPR) repeat protein